MAEAVRTLVRGLGQLLITVGVVLLLFCVYELKVTDLYTDDQQKALTHELRDSWAASRPSRPVDHSVPAGGFLDLPAPDVPLHAPYAVLRIPRLGRDYVKTVVEGVSVEDLKRGAGHWPATAAPGQVGNLVLSGHRTTYGHPFGDLDLLHVGDAIVLETRDGWFTYRTTEQKVVLPSAVDEAYPVPGRKGATPTRRLLTLTTCNPKYSARQRLVVRAELQSTLAKAAGTLPPALAAGG